MKIVLLSGGSGKRLWPMSNDSRSKQFLKVLTSESGTRISMLQRVWTQLDAAGLRESAYICAPKAQYDMIESQVGHVRFIEEPMRRDTFPAIALASTYLSDVQGLPDDEIVAVIPVDPYVDDAYFQTVQQLEDALVSSNAEMALIGVHPEVPTSKFGYIRIRKMGQTGALYSRVVSFVEKPNQERAAQLIAEGALWNCGVFAFRLGFMRAHLVQMQQPTTFAGLTELYPLLPKRSFDYQVVENTKHIVVVPYQGAWEDLGTWGSLSVRMDEAVVGRGASVTCENTHIINELGIPFVAMGLKDVMLVATPDGILAADKEAATGIKNVIEEYPSYPMYEERRWGTYRVLDYQKLGDGTEVLTRAISLKVGRTISYQKHAKRTEVWTFVKGRGEVVIGSAIQSVRPGDVIRIEPDVWHAVRAIESLQFVEVQCGTELVEEDILRSGQSWGDIVAAQVSIG